MRKENELRRMIMRAAGVVTLIGIFDTSATAADAARGEIVFRTCAACHTDKPNAMGPTLKGVYGRKAGSIPEFGYSSAMKRAELVWDETNLRDYIKDPQAKVKGNRMPFVGLKSPADVDDVISYLQRLK